MNNLNFISVFSIIILLVAVVSANRGSSPTEKPESSIQRPTPGGAGSVTNDKFKKRQGFPDLLAPIRAFFSGGRSSRRPFGEPSPNGLRSLASETKPKHNTAHPNSPYFYSRPEFRENNDEEDHQQGFRNEYFRGMPSNGFSGTESNYNHENGRQNYNHHHPSSSLTNQQYYKAQSNYPASNSYQYNY